MTDHGLDHTAHAAEPDPPPAFRIVRTIYIGDRAALTFSNGIIAILRLSDLLNLSREALIAVAGVLERQGQRPAGGDAA